MIEKDYIKKSTAGENILIQNKKPKTGGVRNQWGEKPYYSLDYYLKETFGEKIYKLALDGGMTCPNRDGTLGTGGCIFCSHGGSGDFAERVNSSVSKQIEAAKARVAKKINHGRFIAYFQSYTNTYAPVDYLESLFTQAAGHPDIAALSVATRPDCLSDEIIGLLKRMNKKKPLWVELGLQTIHEDTARLIRRGYKLPCFLDAVSRLKSAGLQVIVHVILGLPGENRRMMLETVQFLGEMEPPIDGIKLQLLHILKGTELSALYQSNPFPVMDMDEYIALITDCIRLLPQHIVIHRITGDGPKSLLQAPLWSKNKRLVLNSITKYLKDTGAYQGEWAALGLTIPSLSTETSKDSSSIY